MFVGQVGCLTLIIVIAALLAGLWLDDLFATRPVITILLMVGSVPVTLFVTFWAVQKTTSRLQSTTKQNQDSDL
jgi:hypothetical protein